MTIPQRELGKTGVRVSILGIGGYHLGMAPSYGEAERIVRGALDGGIDFLDNCWDYNDGRSEEWMGRALRDGYRERAFLMTKLDGRTFEAAQAQLEQSLRRLQTDMIDLVQIHEVIRDDDPERSKGCLDALVKARADGKLRFIGFTGHKDPRMHRAMIETGFPFDTVQMPLNVLDAHYRSFEHEILPIALQRGIGVLGMKPLGAGLILQSGAASAEECLRYAMSIPGVGVTITGCDSVKVLEQALRIGEAFTPLSDDERSRLLARTAPFAAGGKWEQFKTTGTFDGTEQNRHWLTEARL